MKQATPSSYCYIANQFKVGKTIAKEPIWELCLIIQDVLDKCFIHIVNVHKVFVGFHCMGFPNCLQAMDGTHIFILCLAQAAQTFISHKGYLAIILQVIVDHHSHFTHIFASWVGSAHNACIFCNSPLCRMM
ncbi:hypothetical protein Y1Q_0002319 [Alligator mississippiensis]|uniref:DDE Tnp4 domain-containing protein n=1 Tax=Alligator mississippiensis TaxID=8496 RepID=A0A151MGS4_ALLMI|nr:hypothetical protein Y1Q_0002319 [Alligator mississippiensis]